MHYLIVAVAALLVAAAAQAHGLQAHGQGPNLEMIDTAFGRTGDPKKVTRTVDIEMLDTMRFKPDSITVRQGDTLRLRVRNAGKALHELVIGTDKELQEHAELMKKHPDMEHDEPSSPTWRTWTPASATRSSGSSPGRGTSSSPA